jgi:putative ABC transport system permease protein
MVMIKNSAWRKNNIREIKYTLERYLAIVLIIALGVGFFSGLKITQTAMVKTLDSYVLNQQMYDYKLISTLGLSNEDVEYFSSQDGITAEGAISMDFIADMGIKNDLVLKAHSITDKINHLAIKSGRMPKAANECVLDARIFSEDMIGTKIRIASSNEEDIFDAFTYREYMVVGIADSVNYLNYDRGTTSLSDGSIYGFVYMPIEGFSTDYYTEILVRLDGYYEVYSKEYNDFIAQKEKTLKEDLEMRGELRHQEIVDEASQKVLEAEKEYKEAYEEYLSKKADSEKELNEAYKKLKEAEEEIRKQEEKLKEAEDKIAEGEKDYKKSLKEYEKSYRDYETQKANSLAQLESRQKELDLNRETVTKAIEEIEESGIINQHNQLSENILKLEAALLQIEDAESEEYIAISSQLKEAKAGLTDIEASGVLEKYSELKETLTKLDKGQYELDRGKKEANRKFEEAYKQLAAAKESLNKAKVQIENNKEEIASGWEAIKEAKAEYEKGLKEYKEGKEEAHKSFAEAKEEFKKVEEEIDKGWKEVEDIPTAKVYMLNRNQNMGYASFENDSAIVDGVAKVLPIFFFLVAALVCLTTMTRMVDEQRTQIGTLKALGYSDAAISGKYVAYSGSAAIVGSVLGYFLGTKYFPMAIWKAYGMLYGFSSIEYVFDLKLALFSLAVALICSAGVTYISCKSELLMMPAQLIRPKAPKAGKRVLLEYIPFIWKRVGFLHKVSIRNILRYKRRFFMTILGIAGCTSLVVAAMGISNSIRNIVNDQFDTIMKYDYNISFTEAFNKEERKNFIEKNSDILSECVFILSDEIEVVDDNKIKKATVVATDDPNITNIIGLHMDSKTLPYPKDGKATISDRLAEEFKLKPGDTITIKINEVDTTDIEIGSIFENYVGNYLLMTGQTYKALFNKEVQYKNAYATSNNEDLYKVSASLSKDENVATVSVTDDLRNMVNNMMQSLDAIIWLVILCAGALGFVVIYNLNNINITERSREIATIKVIGFYSRETKEYVFRETVILTVIGSLLGLGLGKLLHSFIMDQIKVEAISFKEQIFASSYLIALIVTFMITFLVNLILRRKIERINMTESLKSVE